MIGGACRLAIEVRRADGSLAGVADASVSACVEDALFRSVQAGQLPNDGSLPTLRLEPTLHETQRPEVTALRVSLAGRAPRHYPLEVFGVQARRLVQRLLASREVAVSEKLDWRVVAREEEEALSGRTTRAPFPLEPAGLPDVAPGAFDVCFDAAALRGIFDRVATGGEVERADLLLGRVRHDPERRAVELRVVDVLPVEPGRGGSSSFHFAFDPGSFVEARRAVQARGDGLRSVGWVHNHSPCAACSAKPDCEVDWVFFSEPDLEVHASAFASPVMVALVGGKVGHLPATRPGFRLYGWRDARVTERSFRVEGPGAAAWSPEQGTFLDAEENG